ncbi:clua, partial [Symbiodinium microadriaticum]
ASTQALKQSEMVKAIERLQLRKETEGKAKEVENKPTETEDIAATATAEITEKAAEATEEGNDEIFAPEDLQRIKEIQSEVILNPNCFLHTTCDVDTAVVEKDEETARELADFLWKKAIPYVTESIRLQENVPADGQALTAFLHSAGVNMRYLGRLAALAAEEENIDIENAKKSQKRKNPMPYYWRELLEVEIAARTMKHMINSILSANKALHAAPANVLCLLLNHLLGTGKSTVALTVEESVSLIETKKGSNQKKKCKKRSTEHFHNISYCVTDNMPTCAVFNMSKDDFWTKYSTLAQEKFLHAHDNALITSASAALKGTDPFKVLSRVSKLAILRRVCQLTGIRIMCRDYAFTSPAPFGDSDVQDIVPIVKSCEPDAPVPEARFFLEEAKVLLQQGVYGAAYERAQDASRYVSQVVGSVHNDVSQALSIISQVLLQIGDTKSAIPSLIKKLTIDAQLHGLDSSEILQGHLALSSAYQDIGNHLAASEHLQSAVFIMKLCCGEHHPEMSNIFLRQAAMYQATGRHELSMKCLTVARELVNRNGDQGTFALICQMMSGIFADQENFKDAIALLKQSYAISRQLYGEGEPRTADCKARLEVLLRVSTEKQKKQMADKAERESGDKSKSNSLWLDDDFGAKTSGSKKNKKKRSKK